jgi:hypothetical protein
MYIKRLMLGWCEHKVTVRRTGSGWNVRVFANGSLNQESWVERRRDVGVVSRQMLRWEDKNGNWSDFAVAARKRLNAVPPDGPYGRVHSIKVSDFKV